MPISGNFGRFTATQQPYTGTANLLPEGPDPAHSNVSGTSAYGTYNPQQLPTPTATQQPFIGDNKAPIGQGFQGARAINPRMNANGIMRDFSRFSDVPDAVIQPFSGHFLNDNPPAGGPGPVIATSGYPGQVRGLATKTGGVVKSVDHWGTQVMREAMGAPTMALGATDSVGFTGWLNKVSGAAHADTRTTYIPGHEYSPIMKIALGEHFSVDRVSVLGHGTAISGRAIVKGTIGGSFVDGTDTAEYQATYGDKVGTSVQRRWAQATYSSTATLIGGNSRHTLRGVLPNTIATPYPQPGLIGGILNKNSGIAPNARNLHLGFAVPQLFRSPVPMSDNTTVVNDGSAGGAALGMGF